MAEEEKEIIQQDSDMYGKVIQPMPKEPPKVGVDLSDALMQTLADAAMNNTIDMAALGAFSSLAQSRDRAYARIDTMCEDSTIAAVLETYVEDATEYNAEGNILWAESSDEQVLKMVNNILEAMSVNKNIYRWMACLCKYGDVYLRLFRTSQYDRIYNATTGERIKTSSAGEPPLFQTVFGNTLLELAKENEKIVGITPAMPSGCSMNIMMNAMPDRTFDVGIAEGHAVTFSAGLAKEGMIPFCNIYSSFMQRAYDNVIHDVALQNLHVIMCLDRAGLVGSDGATHQGQFDIAMFRCIPNLTIAVPRNEHILRNMMYTAVNEPRPYVIRYPRGKGILVDWHNEMTTIETGVGEVMMEGEKTAVVGVGPLLYQAQKAIERAKTELGISVGLYDMRFAKPLDENLLEIIANKYEKIITIEDGTMIGGIGSAIEDWIIEKGYKGKKVYKMGLPDAFIEHGTQQELYRMLEIDSEGIFQKIKTIDKE